MTKEQMDAVNFLLMRQLARENPLKYDQETLERLFTAEELRDLEMRGAA